MKTETKTSNEEEALSVNMKWHSASVQKKSRNLMCVLPVWEEARSATVSGSRSEPRWEAVEELAGV